MIKLKKSLAILLSCLMLLSVFTVSSFTGFAATENSLSGKFVLVHDSGDIGQFDADGTITYTAAKDDYVWVRNYDTGVQYCTDGWQGFVDTTVLVNEKATKQFNKLYVSAGTHTLTLVDNGNDTFTLSYGSGEVSSTTQPDTTKENLTTGSYVTSKKYVLVHNAGDIGYFNANNTITYTADKDDYVWIRNYDTGVQYCTDGWQGMVDTVTLVNEKTTKQFNKLYVPAGTVTLTLKDNGDDTFVLSYGNGETTTKESENLTVTESTTATSKSVTETTPTKPTEPSVPTPVSGKFVLVHNTGDIGYFDADGKITFTAEETDYVWVRNYDTGVQYCTDGWQGFVDTVTLVNEKVTTQFNKLCVPEGTYTLTLKDNGDDTFVLSYGTGEITTVSQTETTITSENKTTTDPTATVTSASEPVTETTPTKPTEPSVPTPVSGKFVLVHNTGDIGYFDANGKITFTAEETDYVWVRNYDTGVQYCTDGWQGFVDTVTLVNEKATTQFNKLCVPEGTYTLTLKDNGDDTFVLSYGNSEETTSSTEPTTDTREKLVVLGDSIAAGYGLASQKDSYASLLADTKDYSLKNDAVSGHDSYNLLNLLSTSSSVMSDVTNGDIISISIGGNDIIHNVTTMTQKIASGTINEYLASIILNLQNNLQKTIEKIREVNPDAVIILQTVYNPYTFRPEQQNPLITYLEALYPQFNQTFYTIAGNNQKVYVADVYTAFENDYKENSNPDIIQADVIHPSESGHYLIYTTILNKIDEINGPAKEEYTMGDINNDGVINVADVTYLQKYTVMLVSLDDVGMKIADVNKDGIVNIQDVTLLQKYIVHYEIQSCIGEKVYI